MYFGHRKLLPQLEWHLLRMLLCVSIMSSALPVSRPPHSMNTPEHFLHRMLIIRLSVEETIRELMVMAFVVVMHVCKMMGRP